MEESGDEELLEKKKKYETYNVLNYNFKDSQEYVKKLVHSIPLDDHVKKCNGLYKVAQSCITSKK